MNPFLQILTNHLLFHNPEAISSIFLKGSQTDKKKVDFWSDTDLVLVLNPNQSISSESIISQLDSLGKIIGKEIHQSENQITMRLVLNFNAKIELLDLIIFTSKSWANFKLGAKDHYQILYGEDLIPEISQKKKAIDSQYSKDSIDGIWFVYYLCIGKFMRNDNLIGLHLLMRLIQENLVLKMIDRDQKKGINFHRFGEGEKLPTIFDLDKLDYNDKNKLLDYIEELGKWYDNRLVEQFDDYQSRFPALKQYIEESLKAIRNGI